MKKASQTSLKSALKAHYQQKTLSEDKLEQLLDLQLPAALKENEPAQVDAEFTGDQSRLSRVKRVIRTLFTPNIPTYAFASAAILALILTVLPMPATGPSILAEIAGHHQAPSKITVYSSSLSEIGDQLEQLSFKLIASSKLSSDIWQFLGGSYCSINGELAAQLKVRNRVDNKVYTFYQVEYPAELTLDAIEALSSTNAQGTQVSIWQEGGLLLGLAKTAH